MSQFSGVNHARTERSSRGQRHRIGKRTGWLFSEPANPPERVGVPAVPHTTSKRRRRGTPATNTAGSPGRCAP
jgi:hypothetical protein